MKEQRKKYLTRLTAVLAGALVAPVIATAAPAHAATTDLTASKASQQFVTDQAVQPLIECTVEWARFGEFVQSICQNAVAKTLPDLHATLKDVSK
jgi:hypothetical protein